MTEAHKKAGSGLPGRRGLTGRGDRQADRAGQSVEAVWLGQDWGSTRNGTHARTSRVAE
jgi:hypothetical protein